MKLVEFGDVNSGVIFRYRRRRYMKSCHTTSEYDTEDNAFTFTNDMRPTFFKNATKVYVKE